MRILLRSWTVVETNRNTFFFLFYFSFVYLLQITKSGRVLPVSHIDSVLYYNLSTMLDGKINGSHASLLAVQKFLLQMYGSYPCIFYTHIIVYIYYTWCLGILHNKYICIYVSSKLVYYGIYNFFSTDKYLVPWPIDFFGAKDIFPCGGWRSSIVAHKKTPECPNIVHTNPNHQPNNNREEKNENICEERKK